MGKAKESMETHLVAKIAVNVLISGPIQFNEWQMMRSDYLPDKNNTDKLLLEHV